MKIFLLIVSFFFFTSQLFSEETGVLFQYKTSSGLVWKIFGKGTVQPKYEGEILEGLPEGFGVLSYPFANGKSVVGEWKKGKEWNTEHLKKDGTLLGKFENGEWILTWGVLFEDNKNGDLIWFEDGNEDFQWKYLGEIENMKPNGKGTLTSPDGEIFEGEFREGSFDGQGSYVTPSGYIYEGRWKDKKQNGYGKETFPNRDNYIGEFKDGKKHGKGKWTSSQGEKYTGQFKNGKRHGQGTLISSDGDKYVGKFSKGLKNGTGSLKTTDGSIFKGQFRNDKKHGKGELTSSGGRTYVGEYKNGKKHGQGTFTYPDGKYEGKWKNGKLHGQGSLTFANGNKGVGEFRDNKPWNITTFDKDGNYKWKYVKGVRRL